MNFRRKFTAWKLSRWRCKVLPLAVSALVVSALFDWHQLALDSSMALMPPEPTADVNHLRHTRRLASYLQDIEEPLIQPSSNPCQDLKDAPVVALVTSSPHRLLHRAAVRKTWGSHMPTVFFLGLPARSIDEQLVDNYVEAKQFGDLVVGNFVDAYHNLTLKTMFMVQWGRRHCSHAQFILKTDDDILVNPWTMEMVVKEHPGAVLIGYAKNDSSPHRDVYSKWYLPWWLYHENNIPQYLSGTGYLISGEYLHKLYEAALKVPLINLEDVYLTYLVAKKALGLHLTHDSRLSPYKPVIPIDCTYWSMASIHSLSPDEMVSTWQKISSLAEEYQNDGRTCAFYDRYFYMFSSDSLFRQ